MITNMLPGMRKDLVLPSRSKNNIKKSQIYTSISKVFCVYDDTSILKTSSNTVFGLLDLSGNQNHTYTDTASYRPSFISNGINSKAVCRYGTGGNELQTPPFGINCETSEWSILVCCKIPTLTDGSYKGVITNRPNGISDTWFTFGASYDSAYGIPNYVKTESRNSTLGVTNQTSSYTPDNSFSVYAIIKKTSTFDVYRNGNSIISAGINIGGGTDSTRPWRIGTWFNTTDQSLNGDIVFLAIYQKALSFAERLSMESYINNMYLVY